MFFLKLDPAVSEAPHSLLDFFSFIVLLMKGDLTTISMKPKGLQKFQTDHNERFKRLNICLGIVHCPKHL